MAVKQETNIPDPRGVVSTAVRHVTSNERCDELVNGQRCPELSWVEIDDSGYCPEHGSYWHSTYLRMLRAVAEELSR